MTRIVVSTEYDADVDTVWSVLEPVDRHIDWMADAETIRFQGVQMRGVGTSFDCVTKIGPIRLTDRMVVTEWEPAAAMGVRHEGVVTGTGRFTLTPIGGGRRTRFTWQEELTFPWWLGGRLGSSIGGPTVMRRIWRGNLNRLRPLVERAR